MPYKDKVKLKEYQEEYHKSGYDKKRYQENIEQYRAYTKKYNKEIRKPKLLATKQKAVDYGGNRCSACGNMFSNVCYDFHHIDRNTKYKEVSCMITEMYSWEDIEKELDKCIMVCSNCHRLIEEKINGNL